MNTFIDIKYIGLLSPKLEQFKKKNDGLYNFRCPYCGDSKKNRTKARGYLIHNKTFFVYKCHNCEKSTDFSSLLKFVNTGLYDEYNFEMYKNKELYIQSDDNKKELNLTKPAYLKGDSPLKNIKKISQLSPFHPAVKWVRERNIQSRFHYKLFFCDKFFKWVNTFIPNKFPSLKGDHPRLVIPFLDKENKMFALQGRAFGKEEPKYLTIRLDYSKKLYGLDTINWNKKMYVVEGPIDSLFLDNCVATAHSDLRIDKKENVVLVPDNEPRNKEIVNKLYKLVDNGYNICVWPKTIRHKDINDMVINNIDAVEIKKIIDSNTHSKLSALQKINDWKNC